MKLLYRALTKAVIGFLFLGLMLFLPAGTWRFPGAWLLMGILFLPMLLVSTVLYFKSPALLEKRLDTREQNADQKTVLVFSALLFLAVFVLSGLDFRFGWSRLPRWLRIASAILFLIGYALYAEVLRENAYLSRTVTVQAGQRVIDTGLYGIVRHPMYSATILMFLSMPLVLGSLWSFLLLLAAYPALIAFRIHDEERTLRLGLPGYQAYTNKVKFRLIPFVW